MSTLECTRRMCCLIFSTFFFPSVDISIDVLRQIVRSLSLNSKYGSIGYALGESRIFLPIVLYCLTGATSLSACGLFSSYLNIHVHEHHVLELVVLLPFPSRVHFSCIDTLLYFLKWDFEREQ